MMFGFATPVKPHLITPIVGANAGRPLYVTKNQLFERYALTGSPSESTPFETYKYNFSSGKCERVGLNVPTDNQVHIPSLIAICGSMSSAA